VTMMAMAKEEYIDNDFANEEDDDDNDEQW
jgi:hypothetical protein